MQTNNKQFHRIESDSFLLCRIAQHYLVVELGFGAALSHSHLILNRQMAPT